MLIARASRASSAGLDSYIRTVEGMPAISMEEELRLFKVLRREYQKSAETALLNAHLRYVVNIARGYMDYGQTFADLIQEGNIGLIKALRLFRSEPGVRLFSFAMRRIDLEISRYVVDNWSVVATGVSKEQVRLFVRMRRFKRSRTMLSTAEAKAAASGLGVRLADVLMLEDKLSGEDVSLDLLMEGNYASSVPSAALTDGGNPIAMIEETDWTDSRLARLSAALAVLDERSLDIVSRRWLGLDKPTSLQDISVGYCLSRERIRQIQRRAFIKLRAAVS